MVFFSTLFFRCFLSIFCSLDHTATAAHAVYTFFTRFCFCSALLFFPRQCFVWLQEIFSVYCLGLVSFQCHVHGVSAHAHSQAIRHGFFSSESFCSQAKQKSLLPFSTTGLWRKHGFIIFICQLCIVVCTRVRYLRRNDLNFKTTWSTQMVGFAK